MRRQIAKHLRLGSVSSFAVILAIMILLPVMASGIIQYAITLLMFTTLAVAWNLQGGYLGDLSFGHVSFFGLGAYSVALLDHHGFLHFAPPNVLVGGTVAAAFACVVGLPFLRLRGFYFAIGTLGLSSLLFFMFKDMLRSITLGAAGVTIPPPSPYHIESFYYLILGITVLSIVLSYLVIKSRVGLAFTAIRDNRDAARAAGIDVTYYRILGFAISAFITGVAGSFYAGYSNYIDPSGVFSLTISFTMLVMVFLGGAGTLTGPVVGAFLLYILEEVARRIISSGYYILPALMLIIVFIFMPNGIMGLIRGRGGLRKPWITG